MFFGIDYFYCTLRTCVVTAETLFVFFKTSFDVGGYSGIQTLVCALQHVDDVHSAVACVSASFLETHSCVLVLVTVYPSHMLIMFLLFLKQIRNR